MLHQLPELFKIAINNKDFLLAKFVFTSKSFQAWELETDSNGRDKSSPDNSKSNCKSNCCDPNFDPGDISTILLTMGADYYKLNLYKISKQHWPLLALLFYGKNFFIMQLFSEQQIIHFRSYYSHCTPEHHHNRTPWSQYQPIDFIINSICDFPHRTDGKFFWPATRNLWVKQQFCQKVTGLLAAHHTSNRAPTLDNYNALNRRFLLQFAIARKIRIAAKYVSRDEYLLASTLMLEKASDKIKQATEIALRTNKFPHPVATFLSAIIVDMLYNHQNYRQQAAAQIAAQEAAESTIEVSLQQQNIYRLPCT